MTNNAPPTQQSPRTGVADFYENAYAKSSLLDDLNRPQDRIRFCFPTLLTGKRILDVGCGPGVQVQFLTRSNEVHGIDISGPALEFAAKRGLVTHQVNVEEQGIPFPDEHFDIVICTDLLEHLFDPKFVLQEIRRVLRKDGYAILAVPNHFFWYMRLRVLVGGNLVLPWHAHTETSEEWNYVHIRFFTLRGFERLVTLAGFSISQRFYDAMTVARPRMLPLSWYKCLARRFPSFFRCNF
nr:class I SAM-dependent methyltransferase [Chloroflexota bacterium]